MISAGIVGFGYSARTFHGPLLSSTPGIRLDAVVQRSGDEAGSAYPSAKIYRSVDELLADSAVDLIVIATSNPSHFPIAKQCLLAEKNVVIDKPFATCTQDARELTRLAEKTGKVLSVFHNRRWDGDFLTLRKLIGDDRVGKVTRLDSNFDRYRPTVDTKAWRQRGEPGSGVFFDLGPHLLDQALVAFGEPASVTASIRLERTGAQVDDAFDVALTYADGLRVNLGASMLACVQRPRYSLHGDQGSWIKYELDPQEAALKRGERPPSATWGQEPDTAHGVLTICAEGKSSKEAVETLAGDYLAYYENVRDAIEGKAALAVTSTQAMRVMELLEVCQQSQQEQRTVTLSGATV